jgi:hypothetical protein
MTKENLEKALKSKDNKEVLKLLNPIIEFLKDMLTSGALRKNAIKHLENKGFSYEASLNLVDVAEVRAKNFGLM